MWQGTGFVQIFDAGLILDRNSAEGAGQATRPLFLNAWFLLSGTRHAADCAQTVRRWQPRLL